MLTTHAHPPSGHVVHGPVKCQALDRSLVDTSEGQTRLVVGATSKCLALERVPRRFRLSDGADRTAPKARAEAVRIQGAVQGALPGAGGRLRRPGGEDPAQST